MTKVIAAINTTLDAICDHTAGVADEEIHDHYTQLLNSAGAILYGRTTYQLMEYWRSIRENPSEEKSMNDFAAAIDKVPKIVFSNTLKAVDWKSARLSTRTPEEELRDLREQLDNDILVGSRSLILQLMNLNLIDELQLCVHPVVAGAGSPLFNNIRERTILKLTKTKVFGGGAITLYYEPKKPGTQ